MTRWIVRCLVFVFSGYLAGSAYSAEHHNTPRRAVHLSVPYLDEAVSPAAAAVIRAVRKYEPRMVREDFGQVVAHDNRYARAAVKAVARYERAADQGFVMAHYNLARTFADGRGIDRDFSRALSSFRIAAFQGNVPAILRLAEFYLAGLGVPKNRVEAQAYYYVAASLQNEAAVRAHGLLVPHLNNNQLQQVRKRAREIRDEMPRIDLILQRGQERDLLTAAAEGNLQRIEALLRGGVDANAINALGRTPIITATWRGHVHIVRSLLNAGVEIDAADNQGRTALTWAVINGFPNIVDLLLDEAALVDVRDNEGLTPLMRAAWNGHEDIVAALVAGGADIHAVDDRGITALQRAGAENEQSIVRLLRQGRMHRAQEILVLLANGNRAVGALALLNQRPGGREVILEKANAMLRVDQNGTFGTGTANAEFLRQAFGDLLQDLPAEAAQGKVAATSSPRTSGLMAQPMAFLVQVGLIILAVIAILALLLFFRLRKRS